MSFCGGFVAGTISSFMVLLKSIDFVVEFTDSVVFERDVDEEVGLDGVVVALCVE